MFIYFGRIVFVEWIVYCCVFFFVGVFFFVFFYCFLYYVSYGFIVFFVFVFCIVEDDFIVWVFCINIFVSVVDIEDNVVMIGEFF